MLVLSRRVKEKIRFPGFHTSVQILSIKSGIVRLGIEAPPEVNVVRDELPERTATWGPPSPESGDMTMTNARQQFLGQRLRTASQALGLARFQLRTGQIQELQLTLDQLQEEIQALRRCAEVEEPVRTARPGPQHRGNGSKDGILAGYLD